MSDYMAQYEQDRRDRAAKARALGWHRLLMIARVVVGVLTAFGLMWLLLIGTAGGSQGSFIGFHLTMGLLFACGTVPAVIAYADYLGNDRADYVLEIVVAGAGVLVLVGVTAAFFTVAVLGVLGMCGW